LSRKTDNDLPPHPRVRYRLPAVRFGGDPACAVPRADDPTQPEAHLPADDPDRNPGPAAADLLHALSALSPQATPLEFEEFDPSDNRCCLYGHATPPSSLSEFEFLFC